MSKILVTGGAGFIGSHVCDELLKQGNEVVCVDNLNDYYDPRIKIKNIQNNLSNPNFSFIPKSIREKDRIEEIFKDHKIDSIIHLAARAGVRPSIKEPLKYRETNVVGTLNMLQLAKEYGVRKFIFGSSSSVYGNQSKIPFNEEDSCHTPESPYAASKRACELFCYNYSKLCDMDIVVLRFFTVYGPRNRPDMAVFKFAKSIKEGNPIILYNQGELLRDFTFIDDIKNGVLASLKKRLPNKFEIINLGNSRPIKVNYLVELLEKEMGKKAIIRHEVLQQGDVLQTCADLTKARSLLDWEPITPIENGIKEFTNWFNLNH